MMVDISNGDFGRDDGIRCHACGGKTFLTDDQGRGLRGYNCENCDEITQVQFEWDDPEDDPYDDYYEPPYDVEHADDEVGLAYDCHECPIARFVKIRTNTEFATAD